MKKYEMINHTADIGIKVYGKDLKELFCNAAYAMYDLIADLKKVLPSQSFLIKKEADNCEELLINWLRELHYYYSVEEYLLCEFIIDNLNEKNIKGIAKGEKIDPKKHTLKKEIKAVTYHGMGIKKQKNIFTTQIIFDV